MMMLMMMIRINCKFQNASESLCNVAVAGSSSFAVAWSLYMVPNIYTVNLAMCDQNASCGPSIAADSISSALRTGIWSDGVMTWISYRQAASVNLDDLILVAVDNI